MLDFGTQIGHCFAIALNAKICIIRYWNSQSNDQQQKQKLNPNDIIFPYD